MIELAKQMIAVGEKAIDGKPKSNPISKLGLGSRALNCLRRLNIEYVEQLIWLTRDDVRRVRGMGDETFAEINNALEKIGITWLATKNYKI